MKTLINFKTIAICIIALLSGLLYYKWNRPVQIINKGTLAPSISETVKRYIDENGANHLAVSTKANIVKSKDLEQGTVSSPFIDSVSAVMKIAKTDIDQLTKAKFRLEQKLLAAEKKLDSMGYASYEYKGKYIYIKFNSKPTTDNPNGSFEYQYTGAVNVVDYTEKKRLLGIPIGSRQLTDVYLDDPNAIIMDGVQRITIDKTKQKTIRFGASWQYEPSNNALLFGPYIGLGTPSINLQLLQLYNPNGNTWNTLIRGNIALIGK